MRIINACLVIMITLVGLTNSFDFASLREVQSLKQNSFASSLIETISLSLASNKDGGVEDVLKMLRDLNTQLNEDQKNDDNTFNQKNKEYNDHIEKLNAEIAKLSEEIEVLSARITVLTNLIAQAKLNIESFENRIGNLTQSLADLEVKIVEDRKYYNNKIDGLQLLSSKLLVVNDKLRLMVGSSSAVNIYDHINKTASEIRDIEYRNSQPAPAAPLTSFIQLSKKFNLATNFAQMTIQADQAALEKLMKIISKFSDDSLVQKEEAKRRLDEAETNYVTLKESFENEIKLNVEAKKKQEENKANYENEKMEKETLRAEKEERRKALETEKQINIDLQNNLKVTYEREKKDRAAEVSVVDILVGIVEKRLMK